MRARRPGSAYGNGLRSAASTALKITVVAPMPSPTVTRIVSVISGARSKPRSEIRRSCTNSSKNKPRCTSLSFRRSCVRQYCRVNSTSPNCRSASWRAASGEKPRPINSSTRISR
jgi:hypothetical protein